MASALHKTDFKANSFRNSFFFIESNSSYVSQCVEKSLQDYPFPFLPFLPRFPFPFPLLLPSQKNPRKYRRSWTL